MYKIETCFGDDCWSTKTIKQLDKYHQKIYDEGGFYIDDSGELEIEITEIV